MNRYSDFTNKITRDDLKIKIHHVGGIGGYGPTGVLARIQDTFWYIYDADINALRSSNRIHTKSYKLINRCIGKTNKSASFYKTRAPSASSLFKSSKKAAFYTLLSLDGSAMIWGKQAECAKSYKIKLFSLEYLKKQKLIGDIDFLSIDAQGAELDIIKGAGDSITNDTLGIACETEFSELYEGQPLFDDIMAYLKSRGFRLCQMFNQQHFTNFPYPAHLQGKGFLTVSESLFLKDSENLLKNIERGDIEVASKNITRSLKAAAIHLVFDQLDSTLRILEFLTDNNLISLEKLAKRTNVAYIKLLADVAQAALKVAKSSPELIYRSPNLYDRNKWESSKSFEATFYKIYLMLGYFFGSFINFYISPIGSVYARYGLADLAKVQSRRIFFYSMIAKRSYLDGILMRIFGLGNYMNNYFLKRNYFKGNYFTKS